jgi:hypothetical protein
MESSQCLSEIRLRRQQSEFFSNTGAPRAIFGGKFFLVFCLHCTSMSIISRPEVNRVQVRGVLILPGKRFTSRDPEHHLRNFHDHNYICESGQSGIHT